MYLRVPTASHVACTQEPKEGGQQWLAPVLPSQWHLRSEPWGRLCPSLAGSSPEGVATSRGGGGGGRGSSACSGRGTLGPGGSVLRPPSQASGTGHCPVALPAQTWSPGETQSHGCPLAVVGRTAGRELLGLGRQEQPGMRPGLGFFAASTQAPPPRVEFASFLWASWGFDATGLDLEHGPLERNKKAAGSEGPKATACPGHWLL